MIEIIFWNFLVLMFINYVCDYPLQNFFLAEWKCKNNHALFVHCFIWAMGITIGLQWLGIFAWWKFMMLFIGHLVIDAWKCRGHYKKIGLSDKRAYEIDQFLHVVQIGLCLL